jgi:hypothetical protein
MRKAFVAIVILALLGGAGYGVWRLVGTTTAMAESGPVVPTSRVTRGPLELTVRMSGDLRATKQTQIMAPPVGAAQLRIVDMVDTGIEVAEGDPIMEFDPGEQQFQLEQSRSELLEADQEIIKRQAELEVQAAQDKVTLLAAQFDVRRAELDAKVDETMVAANDAKIRQVTLEQTRRQLAQVQQDVASRQTTTKAALAILNERKMRATMAADRAQQAIDSLVLKAPMDGVVVVQGNQDSAGGIIIFGMPLPAYRVGDSVSSGRLMVEIYDISSMEARARVNEQERANLAVGQDARIESEAIGGLSQTAKILSIAGLGKADVRSGPLRMFDVILGISEPDARLRPGTTVNVIAKGQKIESVLQLPRQCVFEKDGKPIVFVRTPTGFTAKEIKVLNRSEGRVAIEGVDEGTEVAMIDPDKPLGTKPAALPPSPAAGPAGVQK